MEFELIKHPHFRNGIQCRILFDNGNGISIISGRGSYSNSETFEIAPLINDSLIDIDAWHDQVKGYVTTEEITKIVKYAEVHSSEEYIQFLNEFEFQGSYKPTIEDVINSFY